MSFTLCLRSSNSLFDNVAVDGIDLDGSANDGIGITTITTITGSSSYTVTGNNVVPGDKVEVFVASSDAYILFIAILCIWGRFLGMFLFLCGVEHCVGPKIS